MATDELAQRCRELEPELVELRRDLHRHPELAFTERRTSALIADRLTALGLDVRTGVAGTGVVAELDGSGDGPTLLLRADMDALPIDELAGRPHGSQTAGVMHACGHDAHVAALLGAAALLAERRSRLPGGVRLLFQPAEEIAEGALAVIGEGVLEGVDGALAAHVMAAAPFGAVAVWPGEALCGADFFELAFAGQSGHAAVGAAGGGAVLAAARAVSQLQALPAALSPAGLLVVTVASIEGGRAANVVADQVVLHGTLRWARGDDRATLLARIESDAAEIAAGTGTEHRLVLTAGAPPLRNAPGPAATVAAAVRATGRAQTIDPGLLPFGEDFAYVAERVPTCFFGVGAGGPEAAPHHHPAFDVEERAIALTAEIFARAVLGAGR